MNFKVTMLYLFLPPRFLEYETVYEIDINIHKHTELNILGLQYESLAFFLL